MGQANLGQLAYSFGRDPARTRILKFMFAFATTDTYSMRDKGGFSLYIQLKAADGRLWLFKGTNADIGEGLTGAITATQSAEITNVTSCLVTEVSPSERIGVHQNYTETTPNKVVGATYDMDVTRSFNATSSESSEFRVMLGSTDAEVCGAETATAKQVWHEGNWQ
jgi:hypothetical protein